MRYLTIRNRNKRLAFLFFVLLIAIFVLALPESHKNVFLPEENPAIQDEEHNARDFLSYVKDFSLDQRVSLGLHFLNEGYAYSMLRLRNMEAGGTVVSGDVFIKGRVIRDGNKGPVEFSGRLFSNNITLGANALKTINMSFVARADELEIKSLRLGQSYELKGILGLKKNVETDLRLDITRADIEDYSILITPKNPYSVRGAVNGVFYVKGMPGKFFSNGILESRNGQIGSLAYSIATIRFEGFGPVINVADSNLRYKEGTLTIAGYIDLRNIYKGNLFDGLKIKSDMKAIMWSGWDIIKKGPDELNMEKDISDRMRVGFKTFARDPLTTFYDKENPEEMNVQYRVGEENLKFKLRENDEFFGIEHNVKF